MYDKVYEILSILQLSLLEIKYILYCVGGLVTRKPIPRGLWYGYDVELVENILSQIISKTYSFVNDFHFGSSNVVHRVTNQQNLSKLYCIEFPKIHRKTLTRFVGLCEKYANCICIVGLDIYKKNNLDIFEDMRRFAHIKNCKDLLAKFTMYKKNEKEDIIIKRISKQIIDKFPLYLIDKQYLTDYIKINMLE